MSTSAVWEDKFIDILMIILDHSPSHSSTAIPHTLVSRRASTSHLSVKRNDKSVTAELLEVEYSGAGAAKTQTTQAGRVFKYARLNYFWYVAVIQDKPAAVGASNQITWSVDMLLRWPNTKEEMH